MAEGTTVGLAYLNVVPRMDASSALAGSAAAMGSSVGATMATGMKGSFSAGTVALGGIIASLGMQAAQAIGGFFTGSIEAGRNFDTAMSQVAATMGVTTDQVEELRDFALEMGSTTAFSATEAAEALNYMALAGYDSEKSMAMLPNVLNLAAAGNMELARASDMVTDASSALGLSTEQTAVMVDQMAQAASKSNTSVEQLGEAMLTVGGTAKVVKGGTQEISTALGVLADNGIKGSEGGTALRNVILSLTAPTDKAAEAMSSLGLNVFDAEGQMRPMNEILGDMSGLLSGMNEQERADWISTVFNKRDLKSVEALLAATTTNAETGTIRWNELSEAIGDAAGAAQQMAETQLDNLEGDTIKFQSALEGLQIRLYEGVEPALRGITQLGTEMISTISAALSGEDEGPLGTFIAGLGKLHEVFSGVYEAIYPSLSELGVALGDLGNEMMLLVNEVLSAFGFGFADIDLSTGSLTENISSFLIPAIQGMTAFIRENVIPAMHEFAGWVRDNVIPVIQDLSVWVRDNVIPVLSDLAAYVMENVVPAMADFWEWVQEHVVPALATLADYFIQHVLPILSDFANSVMDTVVPALREMWDWFSTNVLPAIKAVAEFVLDYLVPAFASLAGFITGQVRGSLQNLYTFISWTILPIFNALKGAIDWILSGISSILNSAGGLLSSGLLGVFGIGVSFHATGGWVDDPTVLNVAGERGGEFVWPSYGPYLNKYADALASRIGGGGVTITGNEFVVRNDYDIERIGRELSSMWDIENKRSAWVAS